MISSIFSDDNDMKQKINYKKTEKHKHVKLYNMLLNNEWVNKIKEEIKKYLERKKMNTQQTNLWDTANSDLRGKFTALQASSRNKKNLKQSHLMPKGTRKKNTQNQK